MKEDKRYTDAKSTKEAVNYKNNNKYYVISI